ncbi:MAG: sigma-70 family RNA polymerase sigma factor [Bacteroidales bacterium]|jgi:RNA polymerase sigma-70 factor (ECF subfamily)|nr:sigma-70 family RNA polymerase sigma factor [Bacteroidales bacterium]
MSEYSDDELLERFRGEGSRYDAFNRIVARYRERLYWHIRKIVIVHEDTDDVLQNTFVKAWKGLETFRGEAQLYTWLYRIATNESITFLNQKRNRQMIPLEDAEYLLSSSLHYDAYFSGDELQFQLQKAILTLPEKQRIVFNMKYFDEMPYENMSEILGTSVGALKASYHHAVKKIKYWFDLNNS